MTKVAARKERVRAVKLSKLTFINKASNCLKQTDFAFHGKANLLAEDRYLLNISMWL